MGGIWTAFVGFLENVLLTFFHWTGSAGLAIIIFTVVARLLILPLTLKSLQSTRKMQELQPQVKELQRKYGKDPQKLQEETMKLYREFKVNPAGGCLPMLFQLPIFLGVYQAVIGLTRVSVAEHAVSVSIKVLSEHYVPASALIQNLGQAKLSGGFLWLPDLGKTDPLYILPILSVVFQLVVQLMTMPRVQDPQQKAMSQTMLVLPLVFGYIGFTFPSGAVLYWVIGSVLSIVQQYVISGWGSLANYLKFLPADRGLFPPAMTSAATSVSSTSEVSAALPEGATQKLDFWGVLRPLIQEAVADDADMVDDEADSVSASTRLNDIQRQMGQANLRRRRARH